LQRGQFEAMFSDGTNPRYTNRSMRARLRKKEFGNVGRQIRNRER
jgi:hypothetical protein